MQETSIDGETGPTNGSTVTTPTASTLADGAFWSRQLPWAATWAFVAAALFSACTSSTSAPREGPVTWRQQAIESASEATDGSSKSALSDGNVNADEYVRASEAIVSCSERRGFDLALERKYGLLIFSSKSADAGPTLNDCEASGAGEVRRIFEGAYKDPNNVGDAPVLACLEMMGLIHDKPAPKSLLEALDEAAAIPQSQEMISACVYDPNDRSDWMADRTKVIEK